MKFLSNYKKVFFERHNREVNLMDNRIVLDKDKLNEASIIDICKKWNRNSEKWCTLAVANRIIWCADAEEARLGELVDIDNIKSLVYDGETIHVEYKNTLTSNFKGICINHFGIDC